MNDPLLKDRESALDLIKRTALDTWRQQAGLVSAASPKTAVADMNGSDVAIVGRAISRCSADPRIQASADRSPFVSDDFLALANTGVQTGIDWQWLQLNAAVAFTKLTLVGDFREQGLITPAPPPLLLNPEATPIERGTPFITQETGQVQTFAIQVPISDRLYANDKSGIFIQVGQKLAVSAAAALADVCFAAITNNLALVDGDPWLSVIHGNRAAAGAALDVISLGAALAGLRVQTINGLKLSLPPRYLLCDPAIELTARQLTRQYFDPEALTVISDARLTGYGFALIADPAVFPCLARLQIMENPLMVSARRQDGGIAFKAVA
ncbi:MAG: hypothetical protein KDI50_05205, partial [Candidatus Competibacteraceae bacterium]|nr:hypothetical protein [Candidatus Competibacteraceae bacterium]